MRKKQQASGTPKTLGECEPGSVVRIRCNPGRQAEWSPTETVRVTSHLRHATLVRLETDLAQGPFVRNPKQGVIEVLVSPQHVKQGNQGDVDPVGGGR